MTHITDQLHIKWQISNTAISPVVFLVQSDRVREYELRAVKTRWATYDAYIDQAVQ